MNHASSSRPSGPASSRPSGLVSSRTLLAAALLTVLACDSGEKKTGLPPAKDGSTAPVIPGPPPKPDTRSVGSPGAAANSSGVAPVTARYVATALPKHSAELGPRMSGTLTAVLVEEGERVKKGQQLFRLDSRTSRLGVEQADAALQGAAIARDNAQRELERQKVLAEKGTISAAVLERAEAAHPSSLNGVKQAEVMLSMARRSTSDSAVVSPIDGVGPDQLHIDELVKRIDDDDVEEIILATNASVEGESTALYIQQQIGNRDVKISRLARGLSVGVDLEYADQISLGRALEGRQTL